ncbi:MAG TPA: penicillin-binding protein 2 [Rhodocyclaceae bacterium]|nr:penicillin-binding protein 2 [Rhodocyclaceae bacterium]
MKFSHSPVLKHELAPWRARLVLLLLLAAMGALIGRAVYLQAINNEFLIGKGESRYERVLQVPATRGRILDRNGDVLAISTPVKSVWAIPEDAQLQPADVRKLAHLLGVDVREINRKLAEEKGFVFVKRQISPELAERVMAMHLPGIHLQNEYRRYYPGGEVQAHILGFTGVNDAGQEGIELAFNDQLAGQAGSRRVIKDRRGNIVEDVEHIKKPIEGKDVMLSIDGKIQYLAYAALKKTVTENRAKAGAAVVLDAKTGEILALVNLPTYNPNNRSDLVGSQLRNRVFTDTFEPGSTMKPFTIGLALEEGKVRFDTQIQTAPGKLSIGPATIHDSHPYGLLTVAQVIQKSSNVGASKIALSMQPQDMWHMFDALGFGTPLKLGFPGEASGRLRPAKTWKPIEQATMSYGHGLSVTLIQLAHAYMAFARDGDLVPLLLTRADGPVASDKSVYSAQTAREVRAMLEMVVQPGGTAPRAQIPGYRVAGKTGTAHKIEGGVYANKYIASFVGFAPASDPRLIVAVMVDEPSAGKYYGGEVAAPAFAQLMEGALRTLGVPQDIPLKPIDLGTPEQQVRESM